MITYDVMHVAYICDAGRLSLFRPFGHLCTSCCYRDHSFFEVTASKPVTKRFTLIPLLYRPSVVLV